MSLRPRYSLVTLLILTALIAGGVFGVMWWHSPRLVVDPLGSNGEREYTFTRDENGNRIIDGPMVTRHFEDQKLESFVVMYFRQGKCVDWAYRSKVTNLERIEMLSDPNETCPLTAEELRVFHEVRDAELQRLIAAGGSAANQHEGLHDYVIMGGLGKSRRNERPRVPTGD